MKRTIEKTTKLLPIAALLLLLFASCTTTRMTISPYAWHEKMNEIETAIRKLPNDYQPVGYGSEVVNEVVVTGRTSNDMGGHDTLMDNDPALYENYAFQDANGHIIEFVLKRREKTDMHNNKYIYGIEVVQCNCTDRSVFYEICSPNGAVYSVVHLQPDQKSKFYDWTKMGLIGFGGVAVGGIITGIRMRSSFESSLPSF